jgi:ElaB/YqjD/DUF883 family membrane-anchored ribosome-binding protein
MLENTAAGTRALAEELRNVVQQAEALLQAVSDDGTEAVSALRERVYGAVDTAKARLADLEEQTEQVTQRAIRAADSWVRENPWTSIGIAVAAGLLIGALLRGGSRGTDESAHEESMDER